MGVQRAARVPKRCSPCGDVSILVLRPLSTYRFRSQPDNDMLVSAVGTQMMPLLADQTGLGGIGADGVPSQTFGSPGLTSGVNGGTACGVPLDAFLCSPTRLLKRAGASAVVACRLRASCGGRPGLALGELSIVERRYRGCSRCGDEAVSSLGTSVSPMAGSFPVRVRWPLYHMETIVLFIWSGCGSN